jgi:hypothetical protein
MIADEDKLVLSGRLPRTTHGNSGNPVYLEAVSVVCPNPSCGHYSVNVRSVKGYALGETSWATNDIIEQWTVRPSAKVRPLPSYVPEPVVADYREACLIRDISPKASATLSRRCLQGMIRDYWGISKSRLIDEIKALEEKVDPQAWAAIDAIRDVGNIGAHMEKDINIIVDVEPEEAQLLIELIEMLVKDWYVARHNRELAMAGIIKMAAEKKAAKNPSP